MIVARALMRLQAEIWWRLSALPHCRINSPISHRSFHQLEQVLAESRTVCELL